MTTAQLVIRGPRVITPEGLRAASVHIADGRILAVAAFDAVPAGTPIVEAGDAVVMPGIVDTHVHVNEPGRTDWEGFHTATRAAAAGGVTTLVDMPLNSIPATTSLAGLRSKQQAAHGQLWVDLGMWGGVVPGNRHELAPMAEAGALGFKCFLVESGVDEFHHVDESQLRPAMHELARIHRTLLVHAELPGPIAEAEAELARGHHDPRRYATYLASRPRAAENQAIDLVVGLCRDTGARTHIVHHASSDALPQIAAARAAGLPFSAETCPHYLAFAAEDIVDGATAFKCAPPIRERDNRELLWHALQSGILELVASDHSPCAPALKKQELGDFQAAWGGISGLQLALSVVWTEARKRGSSLVDVVRWMCAAPAALAGLSDRKGKLAAGADADIILFRADERSTVEPSRVLHRHKITPYAGRELLGVVESTYLRGRRVWHRGALEDLATPARTDPSPGARMSDETDWTACIDLAAEKYGGAAILCNDEFFAEKDNLLRPHPAVWKEHEYTDRGKWMDGWETRRRREPGYDWCIIRLGLPGQVRGIIVDTSYFRGNYPAECSLEGTSVAPGNDLISTLAPDTMWTPLIPRSPLAGHSANSFAVSEPGRFTHLRLNIFPDGGVARLRVHGEVKPDWAQLRRHGGLVDLAAVEHGGWSVTCSDMFFGARQNLLAPGRPINMSDGWETRRRRGPGHDWNHVRLGARAVIRRLEIDTTHFRGNAPGRVMVEARDGDGPWRVLLPETPTQPHTRHPFEAQLRVLGEVSDLRLNVYPDGGVARLRAFAELPIEAPAPLAHLNHVPQSQAAALLLGCCGSPRWAERMAALRPFEDLAALLRQADRAWWSLGSSDWLTAFTAHPRIGGRKAEADTGARAATWSAQEQAGVDDGVRARLAAANDEYFTRFGFGFIVCATGKTGAQMLALLEQRLTATRTAELRTAAEEQAAITRIRLIKLVEGT